MNTIKQKSIPPVHCRRVCGLAYIVFFVRKLNFTVSLYELNLIKLLEKPLNNIFIYLAPTHYYHHGQQILVTWIFVVDFNAQFKEQTFIKTERKSI